MCARLEVKLFTRVRISLSRASKEEEREKKLENEIGETRIFLFSFFLDSIILLTPLFVLDMGENSQQMGCIELFHEHRSPDVKLSLESRGKVDVSGE